MIEWHPSKKSVEEQKNRVMAIAVSKECERILIGKQDAVIGKLKGNIVDVDFDIEQPFGTLLMNSNHEEGGSWSDAVSCLEEAQKVFLSPIAKQLITKSVKPIEKDALRIFNSKYETGDPVCQFIAMRIWHAYWEIRGKRNKELSDKFLSWAKNIIRPFEMPVFVEAGNSRIDLENPVFRRTPDLEHADRIRVIYSSVEGYDECLILQDSLVPLERFYMTKMDKWTKYIVRCKVCGKCFAADSLQYELCSEVCKKSAQRSARERRKEDASTMEVEKLLAVAYAHWYNRLRKIKESPEWSSEEELQYQGKMERFREEKRRQRKLYINGDISINELRSWLAQQQEVAEQVLQEMKKEKG